MGLKQLDMDCVPFIILVTFADIFDIFDIFETTCLRIITNEKGSCSKIEKLKVTLTANSIAKGDYAAFFRLLSAFLHFLKRKKFTQATKKITVIL